MQRACHVTAVLFCGAFCLFQPGGRPIASRRRMPPIDRGGGRIPLAKRCRAMSTVRQWGSEGSSDQLSSRRQARGREGSGFPHSPVADATPRLDHANRFRPQPCRMKTVPGGDASHLAPSGHIRGPCVTGQCRRSGETPIDPMPRAGGRGPPRHPETPVVPTHRLQRRTANPPDAPSGRPAARPPLGVDTVEHLDGSPVVVHRESVRPAERHLRGSLRYLSSAVSGRSTRRSEVRAIQ